MADCAYLIEKSFYNKDDAPDPMKALSQWPRTGRTAHGFNAFFFAELFGRFRPTTDDADDDDEDMAKWPACAREPLVVPAITSNCASNSTS